MDYGYSKSSAKKFIEEAGKVVVKDALAAVSNQLKKNQVKNPKAMLRVAIREKWHRERYKAGSKSESSQQYSTDHHKTTSEVDDIEE